MPRVRPSALGARTPVGSTPGPPLRLLALLALAGGLAGAAPVRGAALPFTGTLVIDFPALVTYLSPPPPGGMVAYGHPFTFTATGAGVADWDPGAHRLSLAGGTFALAGTLYISDNYGPSLYPLYSVAVEAGNGPGGLGLRGGTMPLIGFQRICLFARCAAGPPANLSVPLAAVGGEATAVHDGLVGVTVRGVPWTVGTIAVGTSRIGTRSVAGFAHGPASATTSAGEAGGVLSLVTPIHVSTDIAATASFAISYGRLTLHFVPEPATALLVGLGATTLALRATRRPGSRPPAHGGGRPAAR